MVDVGAVVAGYRLVKAVGSGPFGLVYRGEDARGRPLAIKFLKPGFLARADGTAAYGRLGGATAVHSQLAHPYLARVYGTVADRQQNAFGQFGEFLEGVPLTKAPMDPRVLRGRDPQGLATLLTWYEQLGDVLTWLHSQGMVHGNLKPNNVLLVSLATERHVKLLDLSWSAIGVAAVSRGPHSFVSPEQYEGAVPDHLSDQWSMATMLERTFTGGHHRLSLGVLPAALVQTVQRATQIDPQRRFRSMNELVEALREIRTDLQLSVGESNDKEQYGASTLPAGEIPLDLTNGAKPSSTDTLVSIDENMVSGRVPASSPEVEPKPTKKVAEGWQSAQKTIPYITKGDLHRHDGSATPMTPQGADDDVGAEPMVRHSIDGIFDDRPLEEERPIEGLNRGATETSEPRFATPLAFNRAPTRDDYRSSPLPFPPRPGSDPDLGEGSSGRDGIASSVAGREYSDTKDLEYPEKVGATSAPNNDDVWGTDRRSPLGRTLGSLVDAAGPPADAAPSPTWIPYLAVLMVFAGATLVGAWSMSTASWPILPIPEAEVVSTATSTGQYEGAIVSVRGDNREVKAIDDEYDASTSQPRPPAPHLTPITPSTDPSPPEKPKRIPRRSTTASRGVRRAERTVLPASPVASDATGAANEARVRSSLPDGQKTAAPLAEPSASTGDNADLPTPPVTQSATATLASAVTSTQARGAIAGGPKPVTPAVVSAAAVSPAASALVATPALNRAPKGNRASKRARKKATKQPKLRKPSLKVVNPQSDCREGQSDACMALGKMKSLAGRRSEAALAYAEACYLGNGEGCMQAARLFVRSRKAARARQMFLAACKAQVPEGCHQASIRTVGSRSRVLKARACSLGRKASCETSRPSTATSLK